MMLRTFSFLISFIFISSQFAYAAPANLVPGNSGNSGQSVAPGQVKKDLSNTTPEEDPSSLGGSSPLSSATPTIFENGFNKEELIEVSLNYFDPAYGNVESTHGYAFEGINHQNFTQPTNLGFQALLLANIIQGDVTTPHISSTDAKDNLNLLVDSLLVDQQNLGFNGLLPWMTFDGSDWVKSNDSFGDQIMLGDNANLTASLGATLGALLDPQFDSDQTVLSLRTKIETFLENQRTGYDYLFDAGENKFRRGYNTFTGEWVGGNNSYIDYFADEFRGALTFLAIRYNYPDEVYTANEIATTVYTLSDGSTLESVMPWDGGAFQVLWPTLLMPETDDTLLQKMHENFVQVALDHAIANDLPGFLSASYADLNEYAGNAGITALSANPAPRNEQVASLYTLGAAYQIAPTEIAVFLETIFTNYPELVSAHGLWEGVNTATGEVIDEQIVANVTSLVLGLAGTSPSYMKDYLASRNLLWRLDEFYNSDAPEQIIADSTAAFTWGDGDVSGTQNGSSYQLSATNFSSSGTAFLYNGANLAGRNLIIRYSSTTSVGNAVLELKESAPNGTFVRHVIDPVGFVNTNGAEATLTISLPENIGLMNLEEFVLLLSGSGALDLNLLEISSRPSDLQDLIYDSTGSFTWGDAYGYQSGENYTIQSSNHTSSGTAFLQDNVDLIGTQLRLRYTSTTAVGDAKFEFKTVDASGSQILYETEPLHLDNTQGEEAEILITLPEGLSLTGIDEIIFLLFGGSGSALDLTITDFDIL